MISIQDVKVTLPNGESKSLLELLREREKEEGEITIEWAKRIYESFKFGGE